MAKTPIKKPNLSRKQVVSKTTTPVKHRQKQDVPLIEYVIEVLLNKREPMHANDIAEAAIALGWQPVGKKPSHVVYTTIHGVIQRKGVESGLKFLGGGVFATEKQAEREGWETREIKPPANFTIDEKGNKVKIFVSDIPLEKRFCGNCKSLEYMGPQELYMKYGVCGNDLKSGRGHCNRKDHACPHWEFRGGDKIRSDREQHEILKLAVLTFNLSVARLRPELSPRDRYIED